MTQGEEMWRREFHRDFVAKFRAANQAARQLRDVTRSHMQLSKQNRELATQLASVEKQLIILQHEKIDEAAEAATAGGGGGGGRGGGSGAGGANAVVSAQLQEKISGLTEELAEARRGEHEASDNRERLLEVEKALQFQAEALKEAQEERDAVQRENAELKGNEGVLRAELETSRAHLERATEETAKLREENDAILTRMLNDKMALVEEMNKMNDMVESLKAQVDDYKQREAAAAKAGKKVGGGLFSVDAADIAAAIAGGSRSGGGGGGRWSMDTASTVPSKCRFHVKAHHTEINSVAYSDTEPGLVFTGSSDGTVKAWDGQTSRCRATLRGTSGGRSGGGGGGLLGSFGGGGGGGGSGSSASAILCVDSHEAIVVGASTDRTVKVWDLHSERLKTSVTGHSNKVHCVRLSSLDGGRVMVSGSTDRTLRAWDTPTGRETKTMRAPSSCNALDLSAVDSGVVVSGHQDGSVRLWDLRSGEQVAVAEKVHEGQVTSCRFSPPGSAGVGGSLPAILTAGRDNCCRLLDSRSLEPVPSSSSSSSSSSSPLSLRHDALRLGYNWSRSAPSPDGRFAAAGSLNGVVVVWDVRGGSATAEEYPTVGGGAVAAGAGRCVAQLRTHQAAVTSCAWSSGVGGWQQVATCDKSGKLCLWD